jgi:hypothetical protein
MAEPTITFGAAASFGTLADWNYQNSTSAVVKDRARTLDRLGNEAASQLHNERTEVTSNYEAGKTSGCAVLPADIGKLVNVLIVTGIDVSTSATGFAALAVTGHNHANNAHADTLQKAAHGIATTVGFGAVDFLGGTAGVNASVESSTLSIACQHNDQVGLGGDHLVGNNFDAMINVTVVWTGVPTTAAGAGWDTVSVETATDNQGFLKTTVTATKKITLA